MDILGASTAVIGIIIYIGGFLGNSFSLLLFAQKGLRQISTGLLFLLLNIFSTIHLISIIVEFLDSIFKVQLIHSSAFRCQFILWLQNATRTICSFLATTISIDRFIRSEYPLQSRQLCTPKRVCQLLIIYILASSVLYACFFYPHNVFDASGNCSFSYNSTFRIIALNVVPAVRFVLICTLPSIIMLGCSGRMLYNIRQSHRRVAQLTGLQNTTVATVNIATSKMSSTATNQQREKRAIDNMLLLMVIANVSTYIITQIPFNTYTIYYGYDTSNGYSQYALIRSLLLIWSSIYFGVGFYLFCIASPQFRKQSLTKLKSIFFCYAPIQRQVLSSRNA